MDADGESVELLDWEVLQKLKDVGPTVDFVGIEADSDGVIRSDYFSLDGQSRYTKTYAVGDDVSVTEEEQEKQQEEEEEERSVESDNPSWIDPSPYATKNSTEFWSDSSTDPSEGQPELQIWDKSLSDSISDSGFGNKNAKIPESETSEHSNVEVVELKSGGEGEGVGEREVEGEKKRIVWWKVPFELIKYCVVRVSPVWSFSVAAAFVGFIILGRRLYKMKRKSHSLKLKVAVDDKKVSQFMGRAARLNEAFSVVRGVPIIRPSLPPSGVTPWPVMSMR